MKKFLKFVLILLIIGAAGFFGYRYYQSKQEENTPVATTSEYVEVTISRGNLSKVVTGTGTLSASRKTNIKLDQAITLTDSLVSVGDPVSKGDPLLEIDTVALQTTIDTLTEELSTTESDIVTVVDSYSTTAYVYMAQTARVKEVYIRAGQYIQDVMAEKGGIALLSLDGWMVVEVPAEDTMKIGTTVRVRIGNSSVEGTVRELNDGMALVSFSDAYADEGEEVTVVYKDHTLGKVEAHIHMPSLFTTDAKGYISTVNMKAGDRKYKNNSVCYLINVPMDDQYQVLCDQRDRQRAQLTTLKELLAQGTINAPEDGIVASLTSTLESELPARETLCTLYVGDEKEMVVTVDELDISSVEIGQRVDVVMDALPDNTYSGVVTKVSQIGTATSGVSVFDVTLTIDGDSLLKLNMNGTATIYVEERENVLLVPISALSSSRGRSYALIKSEIAGDEPGMRTEVSTGLADDSYAEVLSGLNEGDTVLVQSKAVTSTSDSSGSKNNNNYGGGMGDMMMPSGGSMPGGNAPSGGGNAPSGGGNAPSGGGRP